MRKSLATLVLTLVLVVAMASSAFAHICFPTSKPSGAGVAATATLTLDAPPGDQFVFTGGRFTPSGKLKGGFLQISVVLGGQVVATFDVFAHHTLDARNKPFDACDGIGIDDAEACLTEMLNS